MRSFWLVYELPPIDFGWDHLTKIAKVHLGDDGFGAGVWPEWESAQERIGGLLHEPIAEEPRVLFLPDDGTFKPAFAFKTVNNGTTYVVTKYPMDWLHKVGRLAA